MRSRNVLARAWAGKGELGKAIAVLETPSRHIVRMARTPTYNAEWLQTRDQLAQLYQQVGRFQDADAVDAELRALLAVADDDHPIKRRLLQRGLVASGVK